MVMSIDLIPRQATAVLDAVRGLAPRVAARATEIEAARRLPLDLVADLYHRGMLPHAGAP